MDNWKSAWHLASREMKRNWGGWLVSAAFFLYVAAMLVILTHQGTYPSGHAEVRRVTDWALNLFVLAVMPNTGFLLGRRYFTFYRKDSFTQQLRLLKSLPISNRLIVRSRFMQLATAAVVMGALLFGPLYVSLHFDLGGWQFVEMALCWFGYSLVFGSLYVYWEMSLSGKRYLICNLVLTLLYIVVAVVSAMLLKEPFWQLMMEGVRRFGPLLPLVFLGLAAFAVRLSAGAIERRLAVRDLQ
jgi:hypothetical protein